MALTDEERKTVVDLEREKAHRFLAQAIKYSKDEEWDLVVNRYYYACYHIAQALLVHNKLSAKTHAGLIQVVSNYFIRTGLLSAEYGSFMSRLMNLRQKADYNCAFNATRKDVDMCLMQAPQFITAIEKLIG